MNITGNVLQHAQHIEDGVIFSPENADLSYRSLVSLYDTLKGNTPEGVKISTKVDGAPSVACASDFNGRTFVAYKSALDKIVNPQYDKDGNRLQPDLSKICFTEEDVKRVYGSETEGKGPKMLALMKYAKSIGIPKNEIWQGDFMFSHDELFYETIDGEERICFHPNTIIYSIDLNDPLADKIEKADYCVIWHTKYVGTDFGDLHISFDVDSDRLPKNEKFLSLDANINNIAGRVTLTDEETQECENVLNSIKNELDELKKDTTYLNICGSVNFREKMLSFMNYLIKSQHKVQFIENYIESFVKYVSKSFDNKIDSLKKESSKDSWKNKKNKFIDFVFSHEDTINKILDVQKKMVFVKELFEKKLNTIPQKYKNYVQYKNNNIIVPIGQEGFCISDIDGNLQKVVSRLSFSLNNFDPNILKGWESDRRASNHYIKESNDTMLNSINTMKVNAPKVVKNNTLKNVDIKDDFKSELANEVVDTIAKNIDNTGVSIKVKKDESPEGKNKNSQIKLNVSPVDKTDRSIAAKNLYNVLKNTNNDLKAKSFGFGYSTHYSAPVIELSYDMDSWTDKICKMFNLENIDIPDVDIELRFKQNDGKSNISKTTALEEQSQAEVIYKYQPYFFDGELTDELVDDLMSEELDRSSWLSTIKEIAKNVFSEYMKPNEMYYTFRGNFIPSNNDGNTDIESIHTMINKTMSVVNNNIKKHNSIISTNKIELFTTSKDSWNPSDIYLCSRSSYKNFVEEYKKLLNSGYEDFSPFNALLRRYFNTYDVIGISLKQLNNNRVSISERQNFSLELWGPRREVLKNRMNFIDNRIYVPNLEYSDNPNDSPNGLLFRLSYGNNLRWKDKIENQYNNTVIVNCSYRTFHGANSTALSLETKDNYSKARNGKLSNDVLDKLLNKYIDIIIKNGDLQKTIIKGNQKTIVSFNKKNLDLITLPFNNDDIMDNIEIAVDYISKCSTIEVYTKKGERFNTDSWKNYINSLKAHSLEDPDIVINNRLNDWPKMIKFILGICASTTVNDSESKMSLMDLICDLYYGSKKIGDFYAPFIKIC